MTRRGSIAYYLAAVVCGSFFLSASYYLYFVLGRGASAKDWAKGFLFVYFFTILLGFLPELLGAWLLRRVVTALGWTATWQWLIAGTAVFFALVWGVGQAGLALEQQLPLAVKVVLLGAMYVAVSPLWIPVPAAAATAWVLHRVHRAFAEPL